MAFSEAELKKTALKHLLVLFLFGTCETITCSLMGPVPLSHVDGTSVPHIFLERYSSKSLHPVKFY
jgi:hypothetical protein